jgi:hypothetical protein
MRPHGRNALRFSLEEEPHDEVLRRFFFFVVVVVVVASVVFAVICGADGSAAFLLSVAVEFVVGARDVRREGDPSHVQPGGVVPYVFGAQHPRYCLPLLRRRCRRRPHHPRETVSRRLRARCCGSNYDLAVVFVVNVVGVIAFVGFEGIVATATILDFDL